MASQVCQRELNAQLQALTSRVKTLEDNMVSSIELQLKTIVQTMLGLAATMIESAPAAFITDPTILMLAIAQVDVGLWKDVLAALQNADLKQLLLKLAMEQVSIPNYGGAAMDAIEGALAQELADAQAALAAAIGGGGTPEEIAELQAKVAKLQNTLDSVVGFISSSNNASLCKTGSSVLGL